MVDVFLTHEVKDFATWKRLFDAGESLRAGAEIKTNGVYTAADNDNLVTVAAEFPNAETVQGFMSNPELQRTMQEAGVIGKPDVRVLNKVQ